MSGVWKPKFKHLCFVCGWQGIRTRYPRKCPKCGHYAPQAIGPAAGPLYPVSEHDGQAKEIADAAVRLGKMLEVASGNRDVRDAVVRSVARRLNRRQLSFLVGLPVLVNALKRQQEEAAQQ